MALPPPPSLQQLAVVFPEVTNLRQVAIGGFKYVYCATIAGREEAFKLLALPSVGTTESERAARHEYIGRAQREIELLGRCAAPELVKLGSLPPREVTIGGIDFLGYTEEFLIGESVAGYINRNGPPPTEIQTKVLFLSLLRAIKQLWQFETVHRDIKPLNVMMVADPARPFVLLDLGIAYQTREPGLTIDPSVRMATVAYMAPEMLHANFRQALDYRADLYTAGITAFEYATFRHPLQYRAEDPARTLSRIIRQAATPLKTIRGDFSNSFCQLIDQTQKKSPPLRPSNLAMMIQRLETEI